MTEEKDSREEGRGPCGDLTAETTIFTRGIVAAGHDSHYTIPQFVLEASPPLQKLVFSHHKLSRLPEDLRLPRLVHLDLVSNRLTNVDGLSSLTALEVLILSQNHIESLPLAELSLLRELRCEDNELSELGSDDLGRCVDGGFKITTTTQPAVPKSTPPSHRPTIPLAPARILNSSTAAATELIRGCQKR